jgi:hypothetical protein
MATLRRMRNRATRTLFYATASSVATYYFDPQLGPTRRRQFTRWARQLPALRRGKVTPGDVAVDARPLVTAPSGVVQ